MANTFKKLTALLIIATTITGCGSGQTAATRNIKQVTDGVEADSAGIKLRNVLIVKTADAEGVLVATVVNTSNEADSLVSVSIGGAMTTLVAKTSELKKNKPIIFVGDSANADAFIPALASSAGERIDITFTFGKAAPVTVNALVVNGEGIYKDLVRSTPTIPVEVTPAP
jgi:copper(I)-binding protein